LRRPFSDQEFLQSFQHQLAALIEHRAAQADHAGAAAGCQLGHLERRVDRILGKYRLYEPARLFEKTDQRFLNQIGKQPAPRRGVDQGLEAMRQQVWHAAGTAILDVVVHRMVIAAGGLEGREHRRCHGAARNHEAFTEDKILEPALFAYHAMRSGVELGHG
jgi:hypothetical protein